MFPSNPQNLAIGVFYASLHFQAGGILTFLRLQILVISVHISFLQLVDIESVTSQLLWLIKLTLLLQLVLSWEVSGFFNNKWNRLQYQLNVSYESTA